MGSKRGGVGETLRFPHFALIYLDKVGKNALTLVNTEIVVVQQKYWWVISGKLTKWGGCGELSPHGLNVVL